MRSYIKLYGPSINKGLDALDNMIKTLGKGYQYGKIVNHIVSVIDPSIDLLTGTLISEGSEQIGDFDFVVEWKETPTTEEVKNLIQQIDEALLYTGCRYSITTKD